MSREQRKFLELSAAAERCRKRAVEAHLSDVEIVYLSLAELYDDVRIRVAAGHPMSLESSVH